MQASEKCYALIKQFEGLRLDAYLCPAGVPTIGYGHTKNVELNRHINEEQAEAYLIADLAEIAPLVTQMLTVIVFQWEFDSLVSFAFNLGVGSLRGSTLLKELNAGRPDAAAEEFGKWVYAKGKPLNGLVARRSAEAKLFRGDAS